jgi:hypothetical protein
MERSFYQNNSVEVIGLFPFADILQYKLLFTKIPECILEYNIMNNIILGIPTDEAVMNRQKHKVLKILANISEISSKIISALNKITDETMDVSTREIMSIENISTSEGIDELVRLLINKVSSDKHFVHTYAKLCTGMGSIKSKVDVETERKTFISTISTKCKETFDRYCNFKNLIPDDNSDTYNKTKDQFISENFPIIDNEHKLDKVKVANHIMFIGNMYVLNIFKQSAVDSCIDTLIANIQTINFGIEMVTLMVKTVFQKYKAVNPEKLKNYYETFKQIIPTRGTFRDKFMMQDLMEKYPL